MYTYTYKNVYFIYTYITCTYTKIHIYLYIHTYITFTRTSQSCRTPFPPSASLPGPGAERSGLARLWQRGEPEPRGKRRPPVRPRLAPSGEQSGPSRRGPNPRRAGPRRSCPSHHRAVYLLAAPTSSSPLPLAPAHSGPNTSPGGRARPRIRRSDCRSVGVPAY